MAKYKSYCRSFRTPCCFLPALFLLRHPTYTCTVLRDISIFSPSTLYKTCRWCVVSRTCNEFSIVLYEPNITTVHSGYVTAVYCYLIDFIVAGQIRCYNCYHLRLKLRLSIGKWRMSIVSHIAKFRMLCNSAVLRGCKVRSYRLLCHLKAPPYS